MKQMIMLLEIEQDFRLVGFEKCVNWVALYEAGVNVVDRTVIIIIYMRGLPLVFAFCSVIFAH